MVSQKTLESPLDSKKIQPVHPKGNQSWIFIGRTDAEAETSILWPPDAKNWLTRKDPDAGKDWRQEEKGWTGWDSWMASPTWWIWVWVSSRSWWWTGKPCVLQSWGHKESDMTEELNWTKLNHQQTGLPPQSALPIRGKTNKQTKTQHKSHPIWSLHKPLDQS